MPTEEHFLSVCASISNPALSLQSFQSHTEWLPDTHASELCCVPVQRRNEVVRLRMLESSTCFPHTLSYAAHAESGAPCLLLVRLCISASSFTCSFTVDCNSKHSHSGETEKIHWRTDRMHRRVMVQPMSR